MIQTTVYILGEFKCPSAGGEKKALILFLTDIFLLFWSLNYAMFILFFVLLLFSLRQKEILFIQRFRFWLVSTTHCFIIVFFFSFVNIITLHSRDTISLYTEKMLKNSAS